jgi:hypothetical protein
MSGPDPWLTLVLLAAMCAGGLLLQRQLTTLAAAVADHAHRLEKVEQILGEAQ